MDAELHRSARPDPMNGALPREEAVEQIRRLVGSDLRALADHHHITTWINGRLNKGWAGQAIERHLGLPPSSEHGPDFGDWELKVVPLERDRGGRLRVKETMAVTMIDGDIARTPFEDSPLFRKLSSLVLVGRVYEGPTEQRSLVWGVEPFDLGPDLARLLREDYRRVQDMVRIYGLDALSGRLGRFIQPRPKGPGHGSTSRAFYARTQLIAHILDV